MLAPPHDSRLDGAEFDGAEAEAAAEATSAHATLRPAAPLRARARTRAKAQAAAADALRGRRMPRRAADVIGSRASGALTRPPPLPMGGRIRFVAPASPPDPYKVQRGLRRFRELGFRVSLDPLVKSLKMRGHLAASDEERAAALTEAFEDPDVDAIVCAAGGYGTLRLLSLLDFDAIARHPKIFVGFSDVTALHIALGQRSRLVTFHGPMGNLEADDQFGPYTRESFRRAVTSPEPLGEIGVPDDGRLVQTVVPGRAEGPLVGGNLSLVCATLGTPFEIDTRGKILLLEEWREPPYTIDTYLTQLKLAGKLDECAAVVLGEFLHILPDDGPFNHNLEEVVREVLGDLEKPVIFGAPTGHGRHLATLPLGVRCEVDASDDTADGGILRVLDGALGSPKRPSARSKRARGSNGANGGNGGM